MNLEQKSELKKALEIIEKILEKEDLNLDQVWDLIDCKTKIESLIS